MWLSVVTAPAPRPELLTGRERDELVRAAHRGPRRDEWIAGRLAARRALRRRLGGHARDLSVVADPDGAPRVIGAGAPVAISLSHDAGRVAVALATGYGHLAVDLCDRAHARRLPDILTRLRISGDGLEPCAIWAALECALKLRRLAVTALLGAQPNVVATGPGHVRVSGFGTDTACHVRSRPDYVLAWAEEAG